MAQASYSFLDVAALDEVRERFAAGDALAILSADLEEVIWANGPGAALLGHADVETALGAQAPLGAAAKRQIAATSGFPEIGRDRALLVRIATGVSSRAERLLASAVTLPDGEKAILLARPAESGGEDVQAAIGGFAEAGHFVALLDMAGAVQAATAGFARLGLTQDALAEMAHEASDERRIVKRMLDGRRAVLPAGLARLTDTRSLLVVIDENWAEEAAAQEEAEPIEATAEAALATAKQPAGEPSVEEQPAAAREIWYLGSEHDPQIGPAETPLPASEEPEQSGEAQLAATEPTEEPAGEPQPPAQEEPAAIPASIPETSGSGISEPPASGAPTAGPPASEPLAAAQELEVQEPAPQEPASPESTPIQRTAGPMRFVWRTDAEGKFSQISPDFARAVGDEAADIVGRRFEDVANAFGLDPTGDIAGLLARRDTWSGRSVYWPVAGTDLRIPVDLAALPVYDRNRTFEGFRGFGVARIGDAVVDPDGMGLVLVRLPEAAEPVATTPDDEPPKAEDGPAAEKPAQIIDEISLAGEAAADPFRGEKPALSVTTAPDRRLSDKVIRLAEHRPAANDRTPSGGGNAGGGERSLSTGERIAFQQIGERLKKDSGVAADEARERRLPVREATGETGRPADGGDHAAVAAASGGAAEDIAVDTADEELADLIALDGEPPPAAEAPDKDDGETSQPVAESAVPEPPTRKPGRPGLSLLDFAQWDQPEKTAEPAEGDETSRAEEAADDRPAALVEMDEAAALDKRVGPADEMPAAGDAPEAPMSSGVTEAAGGADAGPAAHDTAESPTAGAAPADLGEPQPADIGAHGASDKAAGGLSILEKLPVPVLVHSGDRLHYANGEFFTLTGYGSIRELAEAGGIGVLFADPYEDEAEYEAEHGPRARTDRQMRLKTRDGAEFPVEAFLQSVPWNGGKALLLVLSRVKEGAPGSAGQSPLIAELEARVAEMRTIIDTATDGVVLISRDGNIRSISRPAEALFGMDSDDVAGKPFASLFAIESQRAARDYLNGLSDHGVASVLNDGREVIGREAEGRFIPLFMTIGKLPGDSGYCAVVRDITQWKRAEEELTQARAVAERASSHKSDFLARVSHEIRTPLNAIIGFSELMLDERFGPVANDRYRDYLRDINRSGNHVLDLVNDLLDISKIEAGQQEMAYEAVSVNETLAETVAMMQPQANRERVIIRSSFASKLPDVVADLRSVRQIALNILSNAVRYTQAGGQVIVSTAYEAGGEVVMRVRDTGIGMTPAEIEQALKPFKQINSLKHTRGDGTGLGLPLTKAMVEANRAKFSIHSTPGEGTLVEVAFPSTRVLAD
ncbi:PAS domain S-box protein [Mesorhizobium sp. KR9-304]|uniref:PAS domain S-box protein n=1 Tax=Mesorhizobium sp. KR9-304 TaxID=3156614 RepID=UPI0032B321B0